MEVEEVKNLAQEQGGSRATEQRVMPPLVLCARCSARSLPCSDYSNMLVLVTVSLGRRSRAVEAPG